MRINNNNIKKKVGVIMCDLDYYIKAEEFTIDKLKEYVDLDDNDYIEPESVIDIMKGVSKGKFGYFEWDQTHFFDEDGDLKYTVHSFTLEEFDTLMERNDEMGITTAYEDLDDWHKELWDSKEEYDNYPSSKTD